METLQVIWKAAIAFVALFIVAKATGKKQIAELEFIDYALGITIGSIAAQMTIDRDIPFYDFLIAMTVLTVLDVVICLLSRKSKGLKSFFKGNPIILIEEGKINFENLKKSKLDVNKLLGLCRLKGYFNLSDVAFAIFEDNGELSILPCGQATPVVCRDIDREMPRAKLPSDLIVDGEINENALTEVKKDRAWVLNKLKTQKVPELEDVILAIYDEANDDLIVHTKACPNDKEKGD